MNSDWLSQTMVCGYQLVHGKLGLPGSGWMLRRAAGCWRGLQRYPFPIPGVGTALLDFRDAGAYGMVNAAAGEWENNGPLLTLLTSLLAEGAVYWDIGANVGYLAQHFARPPFKLRHMGVFEPNPRALQTLQSLFSQLAFVSVHPVALGARDETLQMQSSPQGSPEGSLVREMPGAVSFTVPVRRGDDYRRAQNLPMPTVIKIDVEGFEPQVLEGLRDTIREGRPAIIVEHIWLSDDQVLALVPEGYDMIFMLDDGTHTREMAVRGRGANALLAPKELVSALPLRLA